MLITMAVTWAVTRQIHFAAEIGIADTVIKLGVYYFHERAWNRVRFGRQEAPEYEI